MAQVTLLPGTTFIDEAFIGINGLTAEQKTAYPMLLETSQMNDDINFVVEFSGLPPNTDLLLVLFNGVGANKTFNKLIGEWVATSFEDGTTGQSNIMAQINTGETGAGVGTFQFKRSYNLYTTASTNPHEPAFAAAPVPPGIYTLHVEAGAENLYGEFVLYRPGLNFVDSNGDAISNLSFTPETLNNANVGVYLQPVGIPTTSDLLTNFNGAVSSPFEVAIDIINENGGTVMTLNNITVDGTNTLVSGITPGALTTSGTYRFRARWTNTGAPWPGIVTEELSFTYVAEVPPTVTISTAGIPTYNNLPAISQAQAGTSGFTISGSITDNNVTTGSFTVTVTVGTTPTEILTDQPYTGSEFLYLIPANDIPSSDGQISIKIDATLDGGTEIGTDTQNFYVKYTLPTISITTNPIGTILTNSKATNTQTFVTTITGVTEIQRQVDFTNASAFNNVGVAITGLTNGPSNIDFTSAELANFTNGINRKILFLLRDGVNPEQSIAGGGLITFSVDVTVPQISVVSASWGDKLSYVESTADGIVTFTSEGITGYTISFDYGNGYVNTDDISVTGITDDSVTGSTVNTQTISSSILQNFTNGSDREIKIVGTDGENNDSEQIITFSVDTTQPSISSLTKSWGNLLTSLNKGAATLSFDVLGATKYSIFIDANGDGNYDETASVTITDTAANTLINVADVATILNDYTTGDNRKLKVVVEDNTNASSEEVVTFNVDVDVPTVSNVGTIGGSIFYNSTTHAATTSQFTFDVTNANSYEVFITLNDVKQGAALVTGGNVNSDGTITVTLDTTQKATIVTFEGSNIKFLVEVTSTNNGSAEASSDAFLVDTTLPTITFGDIGFATNQNSPYLNRTGAGAGSDVHATIVGATGQQATLSVVGVTLDPAIGTQTPNGNGEVTFNLTTAQLSTILATNTQQTFEITVSDAAGNQNTEQKSFSVYNDIPTLTLTAGTNIQTVNGASTITSLGNTAGASFSVAIADTVATNNYRINSTFGPTAIDTDEDTATSPYTITLSSANIPDTNADSVTLSVTVENLATGNSNTITRNVNLRVEALVINSFTVFGAGAQGPANTLNNARSQLADYEFNFTSKYLTGYSVFADLNGQGYGATAIASGAITYSENQTTTTVNITNNLASFTDGANRKIKIVGNDGGLNTEITTEDTFTVKTALPVINADSMSASFSNTVGNLNFNQGAGAQDETITITVEGASTVNLSILTQSGQQLAGGTQSQTNIPETGIQTLVFDYGTAILDEVNLPNHDEDTFLGPYTILISAQDSVQNDSTATKTLTVDRTVVPIVAVAIGALTGGDPYVTTLDGVTYKLDNISGVCRMIQGKLNGVDLIMNAEMQKDSYTSEKEMNNWTKSVNTSHSFIERQLLHAQSFYTRIFVKYGKEVIIVDMKNGAISMPVSDTITVAPTSSRCIGSSLEMYAGNSASVSYDIKFGGLTLRVKMFENKQLRNEICIIGGENIENAEGYLIKPMNTKQCRVKKLGSSKFISMRKSGYKSSVTEHFYTHQTQKSGLKKLTVKIPRV